jgi:hypothetical protein
MSTIPKMSPGGIRKRAAAAVAVFATALSAVMVIVPAASAAPIFDIAVEGLYSEAQLLEVRATAGQYRLRFGSGGSGVAETGDLPYNATAVQVRDALNALENISTGGGSVAVTAPPTSDSGLYRVVFSGGSLKGTDVSKLVPVDGSNPLVSKYPDKASVDTIEKAGIARRDRRVDYVVSVKNTLPLSTVASVGDVLTCNGAEPPKNWNPAGFEPTLYGYEWLRNGVLIGGATGRVYTVTAEDAGAAVQCLVKGTNAAAASKWASLPATLVAGGSVPSPPAQVSPTGAASRPSIAPTSGAVGVQRTCGSPSNWTAGTPAGTPVSFSYRWLRNGDPIADATSSTYNPVAADDGKVLQCMITGMTGTGAAPNGGALVATSAISSVGSVLNPPTMAVTLLTTPDVSINGLSGVVVEIDLPAGLQSDISFVYAGDGGSSYVPPIGWNCTTQDATVSSVAKAICTRSTTVAPQQQLPPIGVGVRLGTDAPNPFKVTASASADGMSESELAGDEFRFIASQPFGLTDGGLVTELLDFDYSLDREYTQAGGHPAAATARVNFNHHRRLAADGLVVQWVGPNAHVRTLRTDTPAGLIGNPLAVPVLCDDPVKLLRIAAGENCPLESVVGEARYKSHGSGTQGVGDTWSRRPLVAIEPERGELAQFAFADATTGGIYVLNADLRPEAGYTVSVDSAPIPESPEILALGATICSYGGIANAPSLGTASGDGCRRPGDPGAFAQPFLTAPTACGEAPLTRMSADSWEEPGVFSSLSVEEPPMSGCEDVPFSPSVEMELSSEVADSPSGLDASISIPVGGLLAPNGRTQSHLKKTVVELPEGVAVNPSTASGLEGCTDSELGIATDAEPTCPDGSKIGTVTATTPVLEEGLSGAMVLRTPRSTDPMSGEMLRMALIVRNYERGILVKLPGSATADPRTGRVVAKFDDNPQLPIGNVTVKLKGGQRGVLAMPRACGNVITTTSLLPWSRAHLPVGQQSPATNINDQAVDQRCESGFAPSMSAGSSDDRARGAGGTYSFRFSREDGEQWLRGLTAKLPKGLLASVKDVPLCANGLADAGNCPAASRIGVVDAKAGSGDPFVLEEKGEVFLTEGYKGGEYGLMVKIRPVAGPFRGEWELSPIVVRQAIHVDRTTAEVTAVSDPFPLIHHGIPLRAREVNVLVNRGGFMVNPSDCTQKQSSATLVSDEGTTVSFNDPFQVTGCVGLPFGPKLSLALTGKRQVRTGRHPGVKAVVRQAGSSEAGIEKAVVRLSKSLALDPANAQALCEFEDGTSANPEDRCPAGSIVGRARAVSPLLKEPLVGNVYFVKNVRRSSTGNLIRTLPMLIVALRGEIAINLKGESDTTNGGKLVNTFASVPDAPISQFNMNIKGGKDGILAVTRTRRGLINLCTKPKSHVAEADIDGHNGKRNDFDVRMKTPCVKKSSRKAGARAKAGGR